MAATEQQYCLKWNNHRPTLFSVFDTLLEEESLVDVTLSAEGQFLRAHRIILSACSPYFRTLFKSHYLNDKHPVVFLKDMEFENLKSLVEYMYKGEANVPQQMLNAFMKDAQSLEIRGLTGCDTKQIDLGDPMDPVSPPIVTSRGGPMHPQANSTPITSSKKNNSAKNSAASALGPKGILAARLAQMTDQAGPPLGMFGFSPESFPNMLARNPNFLAAAAAAAGPMGLHPPAMKKPRKSTEPRPRGGSPNKDPHKRLKSKSQNVLPTPNNSTNNLSVSTNNNYADDDEDGSLKIDEDADPGNKENLESKMDTGTDDIAEIGDSNGVSEEEEEPSMPGPGGELTDAANEIINPWTGGKLQLLTDEVDENSAQDGALPPFPTHLMDPAILANGRGRIPGVLGPSPNTSGISGGPENAPDMSPAKYSCTRCGRSYQHQATLVRHQRYECGIQASYPCDICNRKFKRRDVLKGHKEKCVNKVQAQAALASMAGAAAVVSAAAGVTGLPAPPTGSPGTGSGAVTPRAMSPPPLIVGTPGTSGSAGDGFRPELHHTF